MQKLPCSRLAKPWPLPQQTNKPHYDKRVYRPRCPVKSCKRLVIDSINNKKKHFVDKSFVTPKETPSDPFEPETREELLALDLAQGLGDRQNLLVYLSYARRHSESFLRQLLGQVREVREENLKKGRAAYFHYLLKKRAEDSIQDIGH